MSPKAATVKDFMTTPVVTLTPEIDVLAAMRTFADHRISGAPVIDDQGNVVGMLTERDCLKTLVVASYYSECCCGAVVGFMSEDVHAVEADTSLLDMAELFVKEKYRAYPVLDQSRLVGMISRQDVIRAILDLA